MGNLFSLVVATIGRISELERLLESLRRQSSNDFEVIVVDQNGDERLVPVLHQFSDLRITRIEAKPGASRARNIGMRAANGEVIAMPDDDCWYSDGLLSSVKGWFDSHPDVDLLFTDVRNQHDRPMRPKWAPRSGPCTKANIWDCSVASTGFFRRKVVDTIGGFDETLGPGPDTIFKACEDIDFCIRPLLFHFSAWYEPAFWVYHPEFQTLDRLQRTTYPYALAYGYVLRSHQYSWGYLARRIGRSLGGFGLNLCRANLPMAYLYLRRAIGQFRGYVFGARYAAGQLQSLRRSGPPS